MVGSVGDVEVFHHGLEGIHDVDEVMTEAIFDAYRVSLWRTGMRSLSYLQGIQSQTPSSGPLPERQRDRPTKAHARLSTVYKDGSSLLSN